MSYILDALNKAERERKRGTIPTLHTVDSMPVTRTPRNPWLWVAVFAVVFNAVLAGLLMYSSTRQAPQPNMAAPIAIAPAAPEPLVAARAPEKQAEPAPLVPLEQTVRRAPAPITLPAVPLMNDQELQAQARELEIESSPIDAATPLDTIEPPAKTAATASDTTPLEQIPLLSEKPIAYQQSIPQFRVDVHVFAQQQENRFVMLNLHRYREGDDGPGGLLIERITQEGIVFLFRGERFRYLINA